MEKLGPAYRIETQRLVLRCWSPTDAPLLNSAVDESLDHLRPWMPWAHDEPQPLQQKVNLLRRFRSQFDRSEDFPYGVFSLDERSVLGGGALHQIDKDVFAIGYWIHVKHIGQGLATEVAAALTKIAFEIEQVDRVEIHCDPKNSRSASVPRKLEFTHEATLRRRVEDHQHQKQDKMIWSIFTETYPNSPAAQAQIKAFDAIGQRLL
ncbi:GNAT family N-acetyltransferase [Leptolyngbya sp. AN03gr2]|uniref:GNAT family N-acetyltransferase n=1 Tax=unclassified Leptolyngbya TaxID=2650499 RepID=UPI003D316061